MHAHIKVLVLSETTFWKKASDLRAYTIAIGCADRIVQGDPSGQRLYFVDFKLGVAPHCLMPCQFCRIHSCPSRIRQALELPNQSQQNVVADLTGDPVVAGGGGAGKERFWNILRKSLARQHCNYRVVQLNFTSEIGVLCMLFDNIFLYLLFHMTSLK